MADDSSTPFSATGVDFSNETQASDFLGQLLDDSVFQIDGNAMARRFWYGVVVLIGLSSILNAAWRLQLWRRLRATHQKKPHPTQSRLAFVTTAVSLSRRLSYLQLIPTANSFWIKIPPLGTIYIILAYYIFIIVLEFVSISSPDIQYWSFLGIRAGWLAVAQIPLIVLLAGKKNLIGLLSGTSYEKLNVLHRWVARGLLLLSIFHFAFLSTSWDNWGLTKLEWATDTAPPTGIAAFAILIWINLSTVSPFRHLSYEFFFVQHVLTFFGFIIALAYHMPGSAKYALVWIYIPSALYLVEKLVQLAFFMWINIVPGQTSLEHLEGGAIRLRVSSKRIRKWTPGNHILLMIPRFGLVQSHPATIMSTPQSHDGDMVFLLRAYGGITKRLLLAAQKGPSSEQGAAAESVKHLVLFNGPYGSSHGDFACFDSVLLIAGATGVTFTMAVLLDIAERSSCNTTSEEIPSHGIPTRSVRFVWMVRDVAWLGWIRNELQYIEERLSNNGIRFSVEIYITQYTEETLKSVDHERILGNTDSQAVTATNSPSKMSLVDPEKRTNEAVNTRTAESQGPGFLVRPGRPNLKIIFENAFSGAEGESAVGVCGPLSLSADVRKEVVNITSRKREFGVYLHVESFS